MACTCRSSSCPFEQFFDFEPTDTAGRVNPLGDVDLVLPVAVFDEEGNATQLEFALTTETVANRRSDGTLVTLAGESLGAQGDASDVALRRAQWIDDGDRAQ